MKHKFLHSIFWQDTVNSSFQRSGIYQKEASEKEKIIFRNKLAQTVRSIAAEYQTEVKETEHLKNIKRLQEKAKALGTQVLAAEAPNFGISQKLLNLYLKFKWCNNEIPVPPHFPVDRIIQERLGIKDPLPWTKFKDEIPYLKVIEIAKNQVENGKYSSVAELELYLYPVK